MKRWLVLTAILILALAAWIWWGREPKPNADAGLTAAKTGSADARDERDVASQSNAGTPREEPLPPLPALGPVAASPFLNATNATYVGDAKCQECHADEYERYSKTFHHRSFRDVNFDLEPPDGDLAHDATGRSYRVYRQNNELRHREMIRDADGNELVLADYPIRYVIGSGHHNVSYVIETDNFLVESPVTWYASLKRWAMSPGFEDYNSGFARPVYFDCLNCHTGRTKSVDGNRARLTVESMPIDCERCHGPASLHVEQRATGKAPSGDRDLTIANPKHLDRETKEAVCAQCHLNGDAQVDVRGRSLEAYLPGMALKDFRVHFSVQGADKSMTVVGHVEQMHLSKCYQSSDQLTCITCHDPHSRPTEEERVGHFRAKCIACHNPEACGLKEADRLAKSPQDDCVSCHMPKTESEVPHFAATHHRIGIHNEGPQPKRPPLAGTLIPVGDLSHLPKLDQDRCLGLAYLSVSRQESHREISEAYRQRAQDILEDVFEAGMRDAETAAALAQIYQRREPPRSLQFAREAMEAKDLTPDIQVKALSAMSDSLIAVREMEAAQRPLEELTKLRRQGADWFYLGVCRYQTGNLEAALDAAKRAAEIRPDQPNFQALLAELYEKTGQTDLAQEHQRLERLLRGPKAN